MKQPTPRAKHEQRLRPSQGEWNLRHLMQILKKRWGIVLFAIASGVVFSVAFQLLFPKKFESKAQILVMRKDPRLAARGVDGGSDSEVRVTEELLATHMQMLQSRNLVDGAMKDEGLSDLPSVIDHLTDRQKPCDYVIENMTVSRGGTGQARTAHVLNIALRSRSESDCERLLRAIIKKYQSFLSEKFQDVNQEAASLINQAQRVLAADLEEAEKKYETFRQESSNLMWKAGSETTNIHRVRYEGILQEIATLQLSRAESAARLDAVNERLDGRSSDDLSDLEKLSLVDEKNLTRVGLLLMAQKGESDSPDFQAQLPTRLAHARVEYDSYASMQLKEKSMLTELGDQHPEVINVRKQIESLEEFMNKQKKELTSGRSNFALDPSALFESYHKLLKNDILAMDRREVRLKTLADESVRLASEMVTDEIQGDSLRREVQRKQALFDAAVDRLRDINLAKDYGGFINEVLSEPEVGLKVMPRLSISIALGMLLMLVIGVTGIAISEYRDRRFRTIAEVQNTLQLPVMGRIPLVTNNSSSRVTSRNGKTIAVSSMSPQVLKSESPGSDAFRMLRTSLVFASGEHYRQIICLTSPSPGDGKSSVAANLAVSLGQLGRKVLLIDCDLRRPSQHELFDASNERGLTTIISGDLDPTDFILATSQKNVWLLTRGDAVTNPAEFLATGEFSRLLESLREKYDHILLDCPPVIPVPDVLVSSAIADGVIVVIRAERTTQMQAQSACISLRQTGAELVGIVVNGLKQGSLNEEYYGYGYEYQYTDSGKSRRTSSKEPTPSKSEGLEVSRLAERNGNPEDHPY